MSWESIVGLEREKKLLQRAIINNRVHNSYLFIGNNGIGKRALAFEFAKVLNCTNPIVTVDEYIACDKCSSCKQIELLKHPNLHLVFSYPTGKSSENKSDNPLSKLTDQQVEDIQNQLAQFASNPYHTITLQSANYIKIEQIREVKRIISMNATNIGKNVVIIMNAEEMTNEAANAFLKTLEEPSENSVIILTTSRKESLLQTILSRTQQLFVNQLNNDEIAEGLVKKFNIEEGKAKLIANLSNGSFAEAIDYSSNDFTDLRIAFVDLFRTVLKKRNYRIEMLSKIEEITKNYDQKKIINGLSLFEIWIRDAFVYSKLQQKLKIINKDQLEVIEKFVVNFNNFNYLSAFEKIDKSIFLIRKSVNIQLILVNLFLGIRQNEYNFY